MDARYACLATTSFPAERQLEVPSPPRAVRGVNDNYFSRGLDTWGCVVEAFPITMPGPGETAAGSAGEQPTKG